jgi:hypothetical protein
MRNMNQKKTQQILEKILQSNEFQGSENYHNLLKYLVEKSLSGSSPKESTIAFEVFGKDLNANDVDSSSVRVYMHNLRQKLDSYYINEGCNDDIRLTIPKGHYQVKFESVVRTSKKDYTRTLIFSNLFMLTVLIVSFLIFVFYTNHTADDKIRVDSKIWAEYINDEKPILVVFGDYYLYMDMTLPRVRYVRDFQINSDQDFNEFILENEQFTSTYRATPHTLLGKFAINCMTDLFNFFAHHGKTIEIKLGSNLQWEDLNQYNVIFIGSFKTLRLLKNLLNNHHFEYIIHPNTLLYKDTENDTVYSYQSPKNQTTGKVKDYAIFSRFPGPNNNVLTIFSSTHDVGHISTVRYFTQWENTNQFEESYLTKENKIYFDALFEVMGYSRIGFQPELLHLGWLESENRLP